MTNRIHAAATAVADAEAAEEAARAPLKAAMEAAALVTDRVDALAMERESIRRRRGAGDPRPDDGERLALVALDAENLAELASGVTARVAIARTAHRDALVAVQAAQAEVAAASTGAEIAVLQAHALDLAALLRETLDRHRTASAALRDRDDLEAVRAGMMAIADHLDPALLGVMRDITEFGGRFGWQRVAWAPSSALVQEARRTDLQRQNTFAALRARGI